MPDQAKKQKWLASASKLCLSLQETGRFASAVDLKAYQTLRAVIVDDKHHKPETTPAATLLAQVRDWMTKVRGTTFDDRFK